ncbi:MAG: hypothetical protein Kow0074_18150 [Candidatus Zixiibacteriota bacterium]
MMTRSVRPIILCTLGAVLAVLMAASAWAGVSWKSDPNIPDTLLLPSADWRGDTVIALDLITATDDSLSVAQVVLVWDNPALRVNSVDLTIGRWAVPGYHRWTTGDTDTGVVVAFMPTQKRLPPGSGAVARIYFGRDSAHSFDSDFQLRSGEVVPSPPLAPYQTLFSDLPNDPYVPGVVTSGTIVFSPCICDQHGELTGDAVIDAVDLNSLIEGIFFNGAPPPADPECPHIHRGDYNCDNAYDVVDLNEMIEYMFFSGTTLCDPCEDLP